MKRSSALSVLGIPYPVSVALEEAIQPAYEPVVRCGVSLCIRISSWVVADSLRTPGASTAAPLGSALDRVRGRRKRRTRR